MATTTYKIKYGDTLGAIAKANGTTIDAIMSANPTIKNANQIFAGTSLSLPGVASSPVTTPTTSPTKTPTTTPTTTPTAGSTTGSSTTDPTDPLYKKPISSVVPDYQFGDNDPIVTKYMEDIKKTAGDTIDEAALRKEARDRIQAQIDSIKIAGEQALARAKVAGQNRLGSTYSTQARSGTLGSNFASSENNQMNEYNRGIETDIEAETQAKIIGLLNQADKDASTDIANRRAAKEKSAEAYSTYLTTRDSDRRTKATSLAKAFALQGIDPTKMSAEDIKKLTDSYGMDITTFSGLVTEQKNAIEKAKIDAEKDRFKTVTDGAQLYDTQTGKVVAENKEDFAPNKYSSGAIIAGAGSNGASGITLGDGTKLRYDDPDFTLKMIRGSANNKRVPTEGELNPIIKAQRALGQLGSITANIQAQDTGPIIGLLRSYNPYDANAQQIKAQLQALIPTLARGVYGEVGVLTDQDINNYAKTVPNLRSTSDVNKLVLAMTIDGIKGSVESQLQNLAAGNRNVANFEPIYTGLKAKSDALRSELGGISSTSSTTTDAGATVRMRGPNGQTGSVPKSKVDSAKAQGWVVIG